MLIKLTDSVNLVNASTSLGGAAGAGAGASGMCRSGRRDEIVGKAGVEGESE